MSKKVNGMIADNPKLMAFFDAENNPGIDADINLNGLLENFWRGLNARAVK